MKTKDLPFAPKDRIIFALDVNTVGKATDLVKLLHPHVGMFKIGLELITTMLVQVVAAKSEEEANALLAEIRELFVLLDGNIFWDGKFDDIPNTVGAAAKVLGPLSVKMFNVHASATVDGLAKAVANKGDALVLAVTVLTSTDSDESELVFGSSARAKVLQYARHAVLAECDGVVCSPLELNLYRKHAELSGLLKVTPGIRDKDAPPDDQNRTMTAYEAIVAGADLLVIGRPIAAAPDPVAAAIAVAVQIDDGLKFLESKKQQVA